MSKKKKIFIAIGGAVGIIALLNVSAFFIGLQSPIVYWGGKIFNFVVFFGGVSAIVFVKRKAISEWFSQRRDQIAQRMKNALTRQKTAREKLAEIEDKMAKLQNEIEGIIRSARSDAEADAVRMKNDTAQRAEAISARARQEIELLAENAKQELQKYAVRRTSEIAISLLEKRLDDKIRAKLFNNAVSALISCLEEARK